MLDSAETLNIPFARKVLEHPIAHPEEHDQDLYGQKMPCGTKACIAGTTVLMDAATTVSWDSLGGMDAEVRVNGQQTGVENRAEELLGLNDADAKALFHDYNDKSALDRLADYITQAEQIQR